MTALGATTIGDLFDRQASATPDRLYFAHHTRNQRYTYAEFKQRIDATAKGLLGIGIAKGDNVAIWAGNVTEWVLTQYATAQYPTTSPRFAKGLPSPAGAKEKLTRGPS